MDGCKRWILTGRIGPIVKADDGDIFRDPQSCFSNHLYGADRRVVVAGKHRSEASLGIQQLLHRLPALADIMVAVHNQARITL